MLFEVNWYIHIYNKQDIHIINWYDNVNWDSNLKWCKLIYIGVE